MPPGERPIRALFPHGSTSCATADKPAAKTGPLSQREREAFWIAFYCGTAMVTSFLKIDSSLEVLY
jgi:hypothetical protein